MDGEATLDIVKETEMLAGSLKADHVHETGWVCLIGANFAIHADDALHDDGGHLTARKSILETIAEEDGQRKRLAQPVRTW